jgi:hypothetical protein
LHPPSYLVSRTDTIESIRQTRRIAAGWSSVRRSDGLPEVGDGVGQTNVETDDTAAETPFIPRAGERGFREGEKTTDTKTRISSPHMEDSGDPQQRVGRTPPT